MDERWNTLSPEAAAAYLRRLPILSAERINAEWQRMDWLKSKPGPPSSS